MVRNGTRRKSSSRGSRRRAISNAPPRLSLTTNTRSVVIAYSASITQNTVRRDIAMNDIFSYPPNTGLTYQYNEGRLDRVNLYWQSDNSTSDAGSVCLNVEDFSENSGTDTCNFDELILYPGSMVRKVWQNVSNKWYPTEPSDRNFRSLNSTDGLFTFTVRHSKVSEVLIGRVILSLHVTLRGRSVLRPPSFQTAGPHYSGAQHSQ